jgi:flagellar basal body P-ring formation protein FlgA
MMNSTTNIEHRTSNIQSLGNPRHWMLVVGCWLLVVLPFLLFACLGGGFVVSLKAGEPSLFQTNSATPVAIASASTNASLRVVLPPRPFSEAELVGLLTATLQRDYVKDKGELELRLTRPWPTRNVPDEPLTIRILDLPPKGVTASSIIRFELRTERESLGTHQMALHAHIWREVWVARSAVKRGMLVADADLERQRRDVLGLYDSLAELSSGDIALEMAEPLQAGAPVLTRSVKLRPVIRRGQAADALVQDGTLSVTMKVEALEDGVPGQTIRARNLQTRRDLRGKVLNEQTILISL